MRNKYNPDPFMRDGKKPRCQIEVVTYSGMWPHYHQCMRSAKVGEYCKQHDPEAVKARERARSKKWDDQWNARRYQIHGSRFFAVLESIAAGHNDARTLAQETIDEFKKGEKDVV